MTIHDIIKLPLGTKVYYVIRGEIRKWVTLGMNPKNDRYFYFYSNGDVSETKCVYLCSEDREGVWEVDYDVAKEVMWEQLVSEVKTKNLIYMNGSKNLDLNG